jgi:hypothetical protein
MITKGKVSWLDGSPAAGLTVELWDRDVGPDDRIAGTATDEEGRYSLTHPQDTDPRWYGRHRRRGDFYITLQQPLHQRVLYRSPIHKNYPAPTLTIDVTLDAGLASVGSNVARGVVVARYPDDRKAPLMDAKVELRDEHLGYDDLLGSALTDEKGAFMVTFQEKEYAKLRAGQSNLYVNIFRKDHIGSWRRIWRSRTARNTGLPCDLGMVEVPVTIVRGQVARYVRCEWDGVTRRSRQEVDASPSELVAQVWDVDAPFNPMDFLAEAPLHQDDEGRWRFELEIVGTNDSPSDFNDIHVLLLHRPPEGVLLCSDEPAAWGSERFENVMPPAVLEVNYGHPIEIVE